MTDDPTRERCQRAFNVALGKVEYDTNGGCWLWGGFIDALGYGLASIHGHGVKKAHRLAWMAERGPIPPGIKVCHRCDVRACVRPDHLFLGTQADNVADMIAKGRDRPPTPQPGSQNPQAVLTEIQVSEIRWLATLSRWSQAEIARSYGVSPMTLSRIVTGQSWQHVHSNWPLPPVPAHFGAPL